MTMHTSASNSFSIAPCQPPHDYQSDSNSTAGPAQPIHASSFQFHADGDVLQAVRTIILDGEPWFIARDVAEVLGYAPLARLGGYTTSLRSLTQGRASSDMRLNGYEAAQTA